MAVDYTYGDKEKQKEKAAADQKVALGSLWWKQEDKEVCSSIFSILKHFETHQGLRRTRNIQCMKLYGNFDALGINAYTYNQLTTLSQGQNRLALNIVKSMCDTVTNKTAKNKPKPMFLTSGGDYKIQKRAKGLTKFVEGLFYEADAYTLSRDRCLDATVFDAGFTHVFERDGRVAMERVFPDELEVDDAEAAYGDPRNLYRKKYLAREIVLERWGDKYAAEILAAPAAKLNQVGHPNLSNLICIAEAWHLPSRKGAKDGRHVLCLENVTLRSEPYKRSYFPFVKQVWGKRLMGWMGQSLADQLTGLQIEINKTLRTIQLAHHLCSVPRFFVEEGSEVLRAHLNNQIGTIVGYRGTKPSLETFNAIPPQLMEHLMWLYNRAYEIVGVSQLSAQSKKPEGLDSGKALRTYNDIESERFITVGQDYENCSLELARQGVDVAREIAEDKGYKVKVASKGVMDTIDFKEVSLEEDQYIMQLFPIAAFSNTPSARFQEVKEYSQAGMIDKETATSLLDFPDLEAVNSRINAPYDNINMQIEMIIDKGIYSAPEPFQKLEMALPMFQSAYLRAKTNGVPETNLELLRRWMSEAHALLQKAQAGAQPPGLPAPTAAGPAPAPQAVPQAPPVSDLLPTTPKAA